MSENVWVSNFFNKLYWELFMKRTNYQVNNEVDFINNLIGFKPDSVMDVCCGVGDILNGFEARGLTKSLGLEFSDDYINERYTNSVIKADACEKNTDDKFELVMNWYSSFAYFDKVNNLKILRNCFNATEKVFVLDMFNSYNILMNFKNSIIYEKSFDGKNYRVNRTSKIDPLIRKLNQTWNFDDGKNTWNYKTSVQLYFVDDIVTLFKEVGFKNVEFFSREQNNLIGFDINNPRIIIKATV